MKKIKEMSKKDKIKYFAIISLLILLIIGTTYALLRLIRKQDTVNLVESDCFDVAMANQENAINLEKAFPLTDEQGRNLTPFTFTLTNNCDVTARYTVNLEVLSGSTLNTNYVATLVNNGTIKTLGTLPKVDTTINDSLESRTIETGILPANASLDFSVSIWVDEDVTLNDDAMNKVLKSKVIVVSTPTNIKTKTEEIIAQLDTTGKCPTVNEDGSVNVTVGEATNGYLCKAKDAYGDSYYYRGNVTNNYVKFADKYWRIVRINGDGTVRVIYDGTSAHANGESSSDRQIGTSVFNSSNNDNAYVGYMYGATGASTYAETHANTNDSTIKAYIDNWYKTNIVGTTNEQYLADNIFCNDRSISSDKPDSSYNNLGYGTNVTAYRWYYFAYSSYNNKMMLTCPQQNDAFTVSDTTNGNGALTYPVGLLSTDEVILAGGWSDNNSGYYLYSGQWWWTSSPNYFGSLACVRDVNSYGYASDGSYVYDSSGGVRPVFNLKAEVLNNGDGTASNPYRPIE